MYPERQQERIDLGVNFTGEGDPKKIPCPAEALREPDVINRWGGNQAHNLYQKALEVLTETEDIKSCVRCVFANEDHQF